MSRQKLTSRDKITNKMTRGGLVEQNITTGEEKRVSQRGAEFQLQKSNQPLEEFGGRSKSGHGRRHNKQQPGKRYSQVGNTPEPQSDSLDNPYNEAPERVTAADSPVPADTQIPQKVAEQPAFETPLRDNKHDGSAQSRRRAQNFRDHIQNATEKADGDSRPADIPHPSDEPQRTRLRFDETEQAVSDGNHLPDGLRSPNGSRPQDKKTLQHGTRYQQRFSDGEKHQGETFIADAKAESGETRAASTPDDLPDAPRTDKTGRLQFSPDEKPPADAPPVSKKLAKAQGKAAKRSAKLDAAHNRLPVKRHVVIEKGFDAEKGTSVRHLRFENEVKTQYDHISGPLPLRPVKAVGNAAIGYGHKKLYQVEHENVGTQAAHKGELAAEAAARSAFRFSKTAPYRRVAKLERKTAKANILLSYRQALENNPKLQSNPLSRFMQKQKIKRQYAKAARDAKRTAVTAQRAGSAAVKLTQMATGFVRRHPMMLGTVCMLILTVFIFTSMFSSCANLISGGVSGIIMSSYLAEDADINAVEVVYTEWENSLREEIENAETDHPGYDEYRYDLDGIGHDPRALMAYLTAVYQNFQYADVYAVLREVFEEQYTLDFAEEIEVRYRTEYYTDDDGHERSRQVPYNWYILNVNLTAKPFPEVTAPRMDISQQEIHDLLMESGGNRQYVMSPFAFDWTPYISSYFGYRADPFTGATDFHTGIDVAVASGTPLIAAHDGVVSSVIYGSTGYGYQMVISGNGGISTRYAHCSALLVSAGQTVKAGDVIARVGSTGNSTGPHVHFEVIKDGVFLNPLYFANQK